MTKRDEEPDGWDGTYIPADTPRGLQVNPIAFFKRLRAAKAADDARRDYQSRHPATAERPSIPPPRRRRANPRAFRDPWDY